MSITAKEKAPAGEAPASAASALVAAKPNGHKKRVLIGVGLLAVIGLGVLGYWYIFMRGTVFSDDARLAGHLVDVSPEVYGRIVDLPIHEGDFIRQGQTIFALESGTQQAAVAESRAALASAQAALAGSQARYDRAVNGSRPEEIKAAQATLKRFESDEELARVCLERTTALRAKDSATQDEFDRAKAAFESARQNRENAAQALALCQQGPRKEDIDAVKAEVDAAKSKVNEEQASLEKAQADLARCTVAAPFDGWVVRRWLEPGAMLIPAQPVVSVFDPASLRVDANIEEKYLGRVAVGDRVDISIDAYPDLHLTGRVMQILRATNSQFSLIPAEGVSGTFIKVTQRVPVRIAVNAPADLPLGPGLSCEVKIRCGTGAATAAKDSARD